MTNNAATHIDPRPSFAKAVALGREVMGNIRPDQFDGPTPCADFDVRQLTGHLIGVLQQVALIGRGRDPFMAPEVVEGVADEAWTSAWDEHAGEIDQAWSDDAVLSTIVTLPWAQMPGAIMLMVYISEVTVHTWDLAMATGQHPVWDDEVVAIAIAGIQQGLPAENRMAQFDQARAGMPEGLADLPPPFGEVVPVPAGSALIDRLVAWNGRRP